MSRGGGTTKPTGAQKRSQSCCFIIRNCCFSTNPVLSPLWEPLPHSPWGRNVGIAPQSPCSHWIWCSNRMRTEDRGSDVSMGISALRSPRSAHRRTLMPMLTSETGVARGAEPRPGPGRKHGDCPKVANRTPPKPEKQADLPLRWSAVLENWRVERAGPLQISSSEHLRTGNTRFRTGGLRKATPPHGQRRTRVLLRLK